MVRPTISIGTARANLAQYTTGPAVLIGTDTKIAAPALQTDNGWQADQKPPAQWENNYNYPRDLWTLWVEAGSFNALLLDHIVETDVNGQTNIAGIVAGGTVGAFDGIQCRPNNNIASNAGINAIADFGKPGGKFQTAVDGLSAMEVRQVGVAGFFGAAIDILCVGEGFMAIDSEASGGFLPSAKFVNLGLAGSGIRGEGGPANPLALLDGGSGVIGIGGDADGGFPGGAGIQGRAGDPDGPAILAENLFANGAGVCVSVEAANRVVGLEIDQTGGRSTAARLRASEVGIDAAAPLVLVPQTFEPGNEGLEAGNVWIERQDIGIGTQYKPRFEGRDFNDFAWTRGPHCHLYAEVGSVTGPLSDAAFDVVASASFDDEMAPFKAGTVIVKLYGIVGRTSVGADIDATSGAVLQVDDLTAVSMIYLDNVDLFPKNLGSDENTLRHEFYRSFEYTLPAGGSRSFKVLAARKLGSVSGSITIGRFRLEIVPKP
jgi:hypothetical protein